MKLPSLTEGLLYGALTIGAGCARGSIDLDLPDDDTAHQDDSGVPSDGGLEDGGANDGGAPDKTEILPCPVDNVHCVTEATEEQCVRALAIAEALPASEIRVYPKDESPSREGNRFEALFNSDDTLDATQALQHFACAKWYTDEGDQGVRGLTSLNRNEEEVSASVDWTSEEWNEANVLRLCILALEGAVPHSTRIADSDITCWNFVIDNAGNPNWLTK